MTNNLVEAVARAIDYHVMEESGEPYRAESAARAAVETVFDALIEGIGPFTEFHDGTVVADYLQAKKAEVLGG